MKDEYYLATGQMAELHRISKRQLQYYDEIGLFSPSYRDENGFRFYSYKQCPILETILSLSQMGMKLSEISEYMDHRSPEALRDLLIGKQKVIEEQMARLQRIDQMMTRYIDTIAQSFAMKKNVVYIEKQEQERLFATPVQCDDTMEAEYQAIADIVADSGELHLYCYTSGSILSENSWRQGNDTNYERFYLKSDTEIPPQYELRKPAGNYLCINWCGSWDTLTEAYGRLRQYAREHDLKLTGDAYEDSIYDEFYEKNEEDYMTKIMIRMEENE